MKKIIIVLLCVFSILIGHIAYNISGGVSGLREDIGLEIKARSNPKLRTILNNKDQYPDAMIQSLYRNEELIDFVYNYPSKKRTCLYKYDRSSHKRTLSSLTSI